MPKMSTATVKERLVTALDKLKKRYPNQKILCETLRSLFLYVKKETPPSSSIPTLVAATPRQEICG